jgi:hypothetical protein
MATIPQSHVAVAGHEKEHNSPKSPSFSEKTTPPAVLPAIAPANPPPNGGTLAWLHVVGGFMLLFNSWGT